MTRVPLSGLNSPAEHLEYFAAGGTWKHGFDPSHAKEVMKNGGSELSIRYHPELNQWLYVMVEPNGFSDKMLLRTAPDLIGPWTQGQVIYHIPEMLPGPHAR